MTALTMGQTVAGFAELAAARAARDPDRLAYAFSHDGGVYSQSLTYGELYRRALGVAERLGEDLKPG
ncbi:MAG: hypothetical protein QM679_01670, partial [Patulibacter sp.]